MRHRFDDELASLCLAHGTPFRQDNLLECYGNKPFGRLHKALREMEAVMVPVFRAAPADPTEERKTYLPIATLDRIKAMLGEASVLARSPKSAASRPWVEACPADTPLRVGEVVAVVASVLGVWWVNACRVVYLVDEDGPVSRFGFAYGTLPGHAESGEERFLVEWDRAASTVWYDILAFSRPRHPLARLGYPLTRRTQRRFARDSAAAMRRAVGGNPDG
jgi:uncharacterized protein (UPF0548 family)